MSATVPAYSLAFLAVACAADVTGPRVAPRAVTTLQYRAYTDRLRPLLAGSLDLVIRDDSTITGSWTIGWVPGADTTTPVGLQVGTGSLAGRLRADTSVTLDLNPGYADNNVVLSGASTVRGLLGRWIWSGIAGPMQEGRFTASYGP